jgi:hypothetical protein
LLIHPHHRQCPPRRIHRFVRPYPTYRVRLLRPRPPALPMSRGASQPPPRCTRTHASVLLLGSILSSYANVEDRPTRASSMPCRHSTPREVPHPTHQVRSQHLLSCPRAVPFRPRRPLPAGRRASAWESYTNVLIETEVSSTALCLNAQAGCRVMHRSLAGVLLGILLAANHGSHAPISAEATLPSMTYPAGWNLVAGAGVPISGADGPIYTWQAGDTAYEAVTPDSALNPGWGYWVYFDTPTPKPLPQIFRSPTIPLPAQEWVMVGGPTAASAIPHGATAVYVYNPLTDQYEQLMTLSLLLWGQGAWAYSTSESMLNFTLPGTAPLPGGSPQP